MSAITDYSVNLHFALQRIIYGCTYGSFCKISAESLMQSNVITSVTCYFFESYRSTDVCRSFLHASHGTAVHITHLSICPESFPCVHLEMVDSAQCSASSSAFEDVWKSHRSEPVFGVCALNCLPDLAVSMTGPLLVSLLP